MGPEKRKDQKSHYMLTYVKGRTQDKGAPSLQIKRFPVKLFSQHTPSSVRLPISLSIGVGPLHSGGSTFHTDEGLLFFHHLNIESHPESFVPTSVSLFRVFLPGLSERDSQRCHSLKPLRRFNRKRAETVRHRVLDVRSRGHYTESGPDSEPSGRVPTRNTTVKGKVQSDNPPLPR